MVTTHLSLQAIDPIIKKFLPKPVENLDINPIGDRIGTRSVIPMWEFNEHTEHVLQRWWEDAHYRITRHVSQLMVGRDEYFLLKFYPEILRKQQYDITLELTASVTIAPTQSVVVPIFDFSPSSMSSTPKVVEWRCGHCRTPNPMKNRLCDRCGATRALLIQEML